MTDKQRLNSALKNLLLVGIVGWIVSLYTLWHRAKVTAGVDLGQSFCNINSSVNCDAVALSAFSKMGGLTVSTWGLLYFVVVILLTIRSLGFANRNTLSVQTAKIHLAIAASGILACFGLAIISIVKIGAFCLVCGIIYLLCFSHFYFAWKTYKLTLKQNNKDSATQKFSTSFLIALVIGVATQPLFEPLTDFAAKSGKIPAQEAEVGMPSEFVSQLMSEYKATNQYEIPAQNSPSDGPAEAKVTVVEFSDFECPHCAHNHESMPNTLAPFGDKVRVIYKNFPLDPACNSGGPHAKACFAARAARCVYNKKGKDTFKKMQDYLFNERENFNKESVKKVAQDLGVSQSEFSACLESAATYQEIKEEIDLGKSLGIESTPSIYVNGRLLKMGANPAVLSEVIKNLLGEK